MQVFVINLDSAPERWARILEDFGRLNLLPVRVSACDGSSLKLRPEDFSEARFRWFHGRQTNPREVGCYLSHLMALRAFLETSDLHAVICEDDVVPNPGLQTVLAGALEFSSHWNVLRLSGLSRGRPLVLATIRSGESLCISLTRIKGAGAYVVDRAAAQAFVDSLLPMWLPFDHAFDREWAFGLRAAYLLPFPCSQTAGDFPSSIQKGRTGKNRTQSPWLATYPYQAWNEFSRWLFRGLSYLQTRACLSSSKSLN